MFRDLIVGSLIAAFASSMTTLSDPPEKRPTWSQAVGRMGVAMIVALVVGAIATDYYKLSPKLTYAACGVSGILGERVIIALVRWLKRFNINLDIEEEKSAKTKPERPSPPPKVERHDRPETQPVLPQPDETEGSQDETDENLSTPPRSHERIRDLEPARLAPYRSGNLRA